jgi:membrane protein DedA with SNARE-associated domain
MFHDLLRTWFEWVQIWGYAGVFILMAMESSIIPVPSELVMPPAAFWAAQGKMSFSGVVIAGVAGSYFGSLLNYWASRWLGQPVVKKYGKFFLMPPEKLALAENWVSRFGTYGIFTARLLPVVRHLISIPAGLLKMPFGSFSIATIVGAGIWCTILSWFGQEVIGNHPELLQTPEAMVGVIREKMLAFLYWESCMHLYFALKISRLNLRLRFKIAALSA